MLIMSIHLFLYLICSVPIDVTLMESIELVFVCVNKHEIAHINSLLSSIIYHILYTIHFIK